MKKRLLLFLLIFSILFGNSMSFKQVYAVDKGETSQPELTDQAMEEVFKAEEKNGLWTITGFIEGKEKNELIIPEIYQGRKVEAIGSRAFYNSRISPARVIISDITLPSSLVKIEDRAFSGNNIPFIKIPKSVIEIGAYAFEKNKVMEILFEEGSKLESIGRNAFSGDQEYKTMQLSSLKLPKGLKSIGQEAFSYSQIEEVELPESIEEIVLQSNGSPIGIFPYTVNKEGKEVITRVFSSSQALTNYKVSSIINPVEVNIRYVNENDEEIKEADFGLVGVEGYLAGASGTINNGSGEGLRDYFVSNITKPHYTEKKFDQISSNYYQKGKEYTFSAPSIENYIVPEDIQKTLKNDTEEIVFKYSRVPTSFVHLDLIGEGISSSKTGENLRKGDQVEIKIIPPNGKTIDKFLINNQDMTNKLSGSDLEYKYGFIIEENTRIEASYKSIDSKETLKIKLSEENIKLGQKTKVKAFYRDLFVGMPNDKITWNLDHEDLASFDKNTGEVTAIGAGRVVLTAMLKDAPETKAQVILNIEPIKAKVRIENIYNTIIEPVDVEVDKLELKEGESYYKDVKFEKAVSGLAVEKALALKGFKTSDKSVFDCGDRLEWMKTIASISPKLPASFMFSVNNEYADKSLGEFELRDQDYIVVYVNQNWENVEAYSYFENENLETKVGIGVPLQLKGKVFNMNNNQTKDTLVGKSTLLLNTDPIENGKGDYYMTDSKGKVNLSFDKAGEYHISAYKLGGLEGRENIISRPYVKIVVKENEGKLAEIPDENLKKAIRKSLGAKDEYSILESDLKSIRKISAMGYLGKIKDLTGLEMAENLEVLELMAGHELKDLKPIEGLKNLKTLNLTSTGLSNEHIIPIGKLTQLEDLRIGTNQLTDIQALNALSNIKYFRATNNLVNFKIESNKTKFEFKDILGESLLYNLSEKEDEEFIKIEDDSITVLKETKKPIRLTYTSKNNEKGVKEFSGDLILDISKVKNEVDKTVLIKALAKEATLVKANATSADGKDVAKDKTWVTPEVDKALKEAKAKAEEVKANDKASQDQVNEAAKALEEAIGNYKPVDGSQEEEKPKEVDKKELIKTTNRADKVVRVPVSIDGKDIDTSKYWTSRADLEGLEKALEKAKALLADKEVKQEEVDRVSEELKQAIKKYQDAKKPGKKSDPSKAIPRDSSTIWSISSRTSPSPVKTGDTNSYVTNPVKSLFTQMTDVRGHWAERVIQYVMEKSYFHGTSETTFSPNRSATRAEFITVLGRLAKVDTKKYTSNKMKDVPAGVYYEAYVNWGIEKGIIKGVGENKFEPNREITREEMAVILDKYVQETDKKYTSQGHKTFKDQGEISYWAEESVNRMTAAGILHGTDENTFKPKNSLTRSEVAQIIYSVEK